MLVDLLSPANYIMVNRDAIKILGLNTAVYCSELLTIYKKVVSKKKFVNDDKYFQVDRDYIKQQTSLEIDAQLKCDINLAKVNIIKIDSTNPNIIFFDVEIFSSVLASEDIKLLDNVSKKVKIENPRGVNKVREEYVIQGLKDSIECRTPEVLFKLKDWIDSVYAAKKGLTKVQVKLFKDKLDDYCNGDLQKALKIIDIAIVHSYIDCQWAINLFEQAGIHKKQNSVNSVNNFTSRSNMMRQQEQKQPVGVSEEVF